MFWFIFFTLFIGFVLWLLLRYDPGKTAGVYSRPTPFYPIKYALMKFVIARRQKKALASQQVEKSDGELVTGEFGGNKRNIEEMERKTKLPNDKPRAGDCVFFNASNANGWWLTLGMAQRPNDVINLFFTLKVPGLGTFVNEELPHTSNVKAIPSDSEYLTESGFRVKCIEPMRKWQISFEGNLVPAQASQPDITKTGPSTTQDPAIKPITSHFELEWTNYGEYFDFDTEISPEIIARSLALEPWSKQLFETLKATHQTHYEHFGKLSGIFGIDEFQTPEKVEMMSMRDHTITSYRNWSQIRRYIIITYHLDDGTCISTTLVSMPETVFSQLQFGYVVTPSLEKIPVDSIDIKLANFGENKKFPKKFNYSFRAGSKTYDVRVEVRDLVRFKMGLDEACYVEENMCEFWVNDVKGYGFTEVEYRIEPY
uniref:DUF3598 domain-containing protein n=1 Tax=Panagrellus redivivus TaxID=6233 RepID=A0A7E4UL95_PANRE